MARARSAPITSCSKKRTRPPITPARLRLGHVVQERRQLEQACARSHAARRASSARCAASSSPNGRQIAQAARGAVGAGHRAERVLEHGEAVRRRLRGARASARSRAGSTPSKPSASRRRSARAARGQREQREQLVAHALGRDAGEPGGGAPDGARRAPASDAGRAPPPAAAPRSVRSGSSSSTPRRRRAASRRARRSASPPVGSMTRARALAQERAQRHRERVRP